jgi:hypothetical protein
MIEFTKVMGDIVPIKQPKPLVRAAGHSAPVLRQDDIRENENHGATDAMGDTIGESEIERARRLPLSPTRPRS